MRNISLLPNEIRLGRRSAQRWNTFVLVICLVVTAFILLYLAMSIFMLMPQGELNAIKLERGTVQSRIDELKPYEDMLNESNAIKGLVTSAMGVNPEWGSFFTGLYNKMPDNIWLTDFSVNYKGQAGEYDIKGRAKTHDDVALWLKELRKMDGINDIQCQFAKKDDANSSYVEFEIKAKVLPGEAYVPSVKGGLVP